MIASEEKQDGLGQGPRPKSSADLEPVIAPVVPTQFRPETEETAEEREQRMVHDVYETIAPHFSKTRYKPWPIIERFLNSLPAHSIGLDSGAGNGKYLPVARSGSEGSWMIALDRSSGLLSDAQRQSEGEGIKEECVRGDLGFDGWRQGVFDFAISIAAIHHLSTPSRRTHSVQMLLKPLFLSARPPYSRFLIYVWAFEQGENSKRKMGILAPTEEMGGVQKGQDVMVPWVVPIKQEKKVKEVKVKRKKRVEGGTDDMISATEIKDTTTITTRMNETTLHNDTSRTEPKEATAAQQAQVFHRYYHLYMKGELRESVLLAASEMGFCIKDDNEKQPAGDKGTKWLRIAEEGYEKDNWYLEGEVGVY